MIAAKIYRILMFILSSSLTICESKKISFFLITYTRKECYVFLGNTCYYKNFIFCNLVNKLSCKRLTQMDDDGIHCDSEEQLACFKITKEFEGNVEALFEFEWTTEIKAKLCRTSYSFPIYN